MITLLFVILCYGLDSPDDSLQLPVQCATLTGNYDHVFCASLTGNTIYEIHTDNNVREISFTDEVFMRIVDFAITPLALYINDGEKIMRYFRSTMNKQEIILSDQITCFGITRSEEIVFADRYTRTIYFLDFTGASRYELEDITVHDLVIVDSLIYVLTPTLVSVYDEFGNILSEWVYNGSFKKIYVQNETIYLYSPGQQTLRVISRDEIQSYDLPFRIKDMAGTDSHVYLLNDRGTVLYLYNRADVQSR